MARPVFNMLCWRGLFVTVLSISQLAGFSFAQMDASSLLSSVPSVTSVEEPSTTSSAPPRIHTVAVGLADHKMKPEVTIADVGDTVEFRFYPLNHSIVRAEYEHPCIPYEMTGTNKKGFFSGFHPVDKILPNPPMFSILINDTLPIYFYCSAPGSCITWGMIGVINPQANNSIDRQRQLALDSSYMLQPGEPFPSESPMPSSLPTNLPSSLSSSLPTSADNQDKKESKSSGLSTGAIAGIAVGAAALLILGALLFYFWGRNKALKDEVDRTRSTIWRRGNSSPSPTNMMPPTAQTAPPNGQDPTSTVYQHFAPQNQQSIYPFPQKYPSTSVSPAPPHAIYSHSPPPPPSQLFPQHAHDHNADVNPATMMGFASPNPHTHTRTNTVESTGPWSTTPSAYGHIVTADGAAPAYEENMHHTEPRELDLGMGMRQSQVLGPVEMDGEGKVTGDVDEQGKVVQGR